MLGRTVHISKCRETATIWRLEIMLDTCSENGREVTKANGTLSIIVKIVEAVHLMVTVENYSVLGTITCKEAL